MMEQIYILIPVFFIIALLYSQAGFGGGSSYLAILALCSLDYGIIKSTALLCNIVVVLGAACLYYKNGFIKFKKILPLIILSIPFAYFGGRVLLEESLFFIILGITLLLVAVLMIFPREEKDTLNKSNYLSNGMIGGSIGFLSGLVGIGGGIFLAPFLHLTQWDKAKTIAATASVFILVNSLAGLIGQASLEGFSINWDFSIPLMLAVLVGGQIGSGITIQYLKPKTVKYITVFLITIVGIRILIKYTFL